MGPEDLNLQLTFISLLTLMLSMRPSYTRPFYVPRPSAVPINIVVFLRLSVFELEAQKGVEKADIGVNVPENRRRTLEPIVNWSR